MYAFLPTGRGGIYEGVRIRFCFCEACGDHCLKGQAENPYYVYVQQREGVAKLLTCCTCKMVERRDGA